MQIQFFFLVINVRLEVYFVDGIVYLLFWKKNILDIISESVYPLQWRGNVVTDSDSELCKSRPEVAEMMVKNAPHDVVCIIQDKFRCHWTIDCTVK